MTVSMSSIFQQLKVSFLGLNKISCQITMSRSRIGRLTNFMFLPWKSWLIWLFWYYCRSVLSKNHRGQWTRRQCKFSVRTFRKSGCLYEIWFLFRIGFWTKWQIDKGLKSYMKKKLDFETKLQIDNELKSFLKKQSR